MQLQKNSLLTLCSDRILQDVSFNKFHCAKLVMDSLCAFDDQSMNRMAVAICSILGNKNNPFCCFRTYGLLRVSAAKITTAETSQLGSNPLYMKKLLSMVENKVSQIQVDITMKFTLSALWNLTGKLYLYVYCNIKKHELDLLMFIVRNMNCTILCLLYLKKHELD